jgi:iron complex outermembrane recepter protein
MAVAVSLFASPVFAATDQASTSTDNASSATLGELVVVAQKREQKIETVPVAVTAFSGEQRKLIGIATVQDLTDFTPGLSFTAVSDRPYIRGVGRNTDNLSTASAVATYYNGVYYGANASIILQKDDLFIGATEVDRGPQNSLHGSNADGGTISYTSQKPTNSFYAEGRVGVGNYGTYFGEAVVSGPISDNVRFRIGGNYTDENGGFFNNLDGPPQGGTLALGNSGTSHYLEAQIDANIGHLDIWAMASTGDFDSNYHTVASLGTIPVTFTQANFAYMPSSFYGLCAPSLVNAQNAATCAAQVSGGQAPVVSAVTDPVVASQFPGNNPTNLNSRNFIQESTSTNDMNDDVALATNWTYHFPSFDLTYIGGFQSFNYQLNYTTGADSGVLSYQLAGPVGLGNLTIDGEPDTTYFAETDQSFSHEIDITSTGSSRFQYLGGLYWYHEHYDQPVDAGVEPLQTQLANPIYLSGVGVGGPVCGGGAPLCAAPSDAMSAISSSDTDLTYDSAAVFGQLDYKFSDQWKVSGALRYTGDHKSGYQEWRFEEFDVTPGLQSTELGAATPAIDFTSVAICGFDPTAATPCNASYPGAGVAHLVNASGFYMRPLDATWRALTGEATVDWTPDSTTLLYAKYSRGYKSGGFSTYTIGANPETNPEFVDAFEVGGKKTVGKTFTLNAAAFYYNYANDQVPVTVLSDGLLTPELYNVKTARNYGLELESVWRPIDPLTVSLQYSYLQAKIVSTGGQCIEDTTDPGAAAPGANIAGCPAASGGVQAQNVVGQYLPEAPPNKVSLNALYTLNFDPGKLILSGSLIWKDKTYDSIFNRYYSMQPSYSQVNLRATWTDTQDRYNIILFCNNVFNTLGYDAASGTLLAPGDILEGPSLTAPRTFGMQFQYRFK